jgi:hypothetical protein
MRDADCTILECPRCQSNCAGIIASSPPQAKCSDCGCIYDIATVRLPLEPKSSRWKRKASLDARHRRDSGPQELEVKPVARPSAQQLGTLHVHTESIIGSGAQALLKTHHRGAKLAKMYGEEFAEQWRLKTDWLQGLEATHRGRERAKYAMRWRPTFLACVALSHSVILGARAADVSPTTVIAHRNADPEFDAQVLAAQDHCIELLHAVAMRRVIEGDCEPIFWQGIEVGHVRKFDGRLQLEMLRAHMPAKFETPGAKGALVGGNVESLIICGPEEIAAIQAARQEALAAMNPKPVEVLSERTIT